MVRFPAFGRGKKSVPEEDLLARPDGPLPSASVDDQANEPSASADDQVQEHQTEEPRPQAEAKRTRAEEKQARAQAKKSRAEAKKRRAEANKGPGLASRMLKDPAARVRLFIWGFAGLLAFAAIMIVALGATSSYWFCANGCHKVQDDTITAYQHSAHSRVNCMACHMPVDASPVTFMLHKVKALGELYMTVTNNFDLPLNAKDEVAAEMPSEQCTQCHGTNRKITPPPGLLIDHQKHADQGITCTTCHNRVAHVEDFELKNKDPKTGKPNQPHTDFMTMTACFRCHSQATYAKAPGTCTACHTKDFNLVPSFHKKPGFFPKDHGKLALEEQKSVAEAVAEEKAASEPSKGASLGGPAIAAAAEAKPEGELPNVKTINTCFTCHAEKFCTDCHGVVMPHPTEFVKQHATFGKNSPKACERCHGSAATFCDQCHHGTQLKYSYNPSVPWKTQHPQAVSKTGAAACFACHQNTYCAKCHVRGGSLPPSGN